jgi:hypothetical protein
VVVATLAAAPAVRADNGASVATADAPQSAAAAAATTPETGGEQAPDAAATPTAPAGGDQSAAVGDVAAGAGETAGAAEGAGASDAALGNSDAAPGHTDPGPGNSDAAPGHTDPAPGNSDAAPGHSDGEQGASVAQSADSSANAQQQGVGNTNVDVRVDTPGNGPQVSQENRAEGSAEAAITAESSTPAISDQSAASAAAASQADVQNTAVSVRVGSPGDDAGVDQSNIVAATASTTVVPPAEGPSEVDESASAAATQDGVANTSVSIRVFSPGTDGPLTQTNDAAATADTSGPGGASAAATQNDAQNTHVSVRVESAGSSGPVSQQSASSTSAGTGVAVATTGNGVDTDLSVVVDGDHLAQPGANGLQVWIWTWNWDRDESDALGGSVDAQPSTWDWIWSDANGQPGNGFGQATTRTATQDEQTPGSWTWSWSWTRDGLPNWMWQWDRRDALPCASCVWIWNWTWNWTGQPAPTGSAAPPVELGTVPGAQEQANVVVANAVATVSADVTQTIAQDGAGEQFAGQLLTVDQFADASASATQSDVASVATAALLAPQLNRVTGHASVTVAGDLVQRVEQTMLVDEDGTAVQWSGQEIDLVQHARADVRVTQRGVSVWTAGTHVAAGVSSADAAAGVDQHVVQDALVGGGETDQSAGQLTLLEQTGTAVSMVEQTDAPAARFVAGTARARSASGAVARVDQDVAQSAARGGGLGSQTAMQIAYVGQTGVASATTSQRAGGASSAVAASDATAANRALVVQVGVQESSGALALDVQDLTQQSIVVQDAVAVSTSAGGIAGAAVAVNCAIVQQTAAQSLAGGTVTASNADLAAFCAPPSAVPTGGTGVEPVLLSGTSSVLAVESAAGTSVPVSDVDVAVSHGRRSAAAPVLRARATATRVSPMRPEPGAGRPATGLPLTTQISVPPPTQARLDTRPGDHAGAGDAGREPPLPPAGDPPLWVSALAAAAAGGAGPSGIAAILLAFALVPPLLVRAREGSVVRRPAGAFSQVDVPV